MNANHNRQIKPLRTNKSIKVNNFKDIFQHKKRRAYCIYIKKPGENYCHSEKTMSNFTLHTC